MEYTRRAIALGFFDGVHVGHQKLMDMAIRRAREKGAISSVFTFDRHPSEVITGQPVPMLVNPAVRGEEIRRLGGVDEVIFSHFDETMRHMPWRQFVRQVLVEQLGAVHIVSGRNNRFGYKGEGTSAGMAEECARLGVGYDCIEDVQVDGVTVSSTYIRGLIAEGNMERVARFLGRPYTIAGQVTHGRQVGRRLGVPTLNLPMPPGMQQPPLGVYFTEVGCGGRVYPAVTNIGTRPTFLEDNAVVIEPQLLDYQGDLYGRQVEVELLHFRRPEKRFSSPQTLRQAILEDEKAARAYLEGRDGL